MGLIQRKLQRAYHEKELLLGEISTLKQQIRVNRNQGMSEDSRKDLFDSLLESNLRSGTLCCIMCMKAHLVKR